MSETHGAHAEHDKSIYYKVFGALLVLTVVTVALNRLHVGLALAITLALIVATFKASLVASFFMHLIAEKKSIYIILSLTAVFFIGMLFLIIGSKYSVPEGTVYLEKNRKVVASPSESHHEDSHTGGGHH